MEPRVRRRVAIGGRVQGVGFRPWAARRARELDLAGSVRNAGGAVEIAIEGSTAAIDAFLRTLREAPPRGARIEHVDPVPEAPRGVRGFSIEPSCDAPAARGIPARIPLDAPLCAECLTELFDPCNRRYRHPFAHCAACGPRAALLVALPYDRARTTLRAFAPCAACRREYDDPGDRRHHAETIACHACGPTLVAQRADGAFVVGDPIEHAAELVRAGGIVAMKGGGGFHLVADATNAAAIARLRKRKQRPSKPFALLVPDLATARALTDLDAAAEVLLASDERPVVIAPRRDAGVAACGIAASVAPGIRDLGLILPHAPLEWLLCFAPGSMPERDPARFAALVFTSANRSGDPTISDGAEARRELASIADLFLDHDRAVARPNDDSVLRSAAGGPIPIRLSRGSAPRTLRMPAGLRAPTPILALGGDLKAALAVAIGDEIVLGEHVGDLQSVAAADAIEARALSLCALLGVVPAVAVHDAHPDSIAGRIAAQLAPRTLAVQHHHAHAVACLVEHERHEPAIALVLDGMGYGTDGTAWGGELLRVDAAHSERLAHLEQVPLPGGDAAAREPWRMASVWLARAFPDGAPVLPWHARRDPARQNALLAFAARGIGSPPTSSCGRLFDAVASLFDLADVATHEAEAAMALEALASRCEGPVPSLDGGAVPRSAATEIEIASLIRSLVHGLASGQERDALARAFHESVAQRLAGAAIEHARRAHLAAIVLSGGCLQNRVLSEALATRIAAAGLEALRHRVIPPGDGGLAIGQLAVAAARLAVGADER